jgi:uncharacterized protein with PQ loop repeat
MGIAPVLQIRRMLRQRSSRDVSVGYFMVLLVGFVLWIAYGAAAGIIVLVIPNAVALLIGAAVVIVALLLRRRPSRTTSAPADGRDTTRGDIPELTLMVDMPVIVRHQDRGALRLDHRHDQALCRRRAVI